MKFHDEVIFAAVVNIHERNRNLSDIFTFMFWEIPLIMENNDEKIVSGQRISVFYHHDTRNNYIRFA